MGKAKRLRREAVIAGNEKPFRQPGITPLPDKLELPPIEDIPHNIPPKSGIGDVPIISADSLPPGTIIVVAPGRKCTVIKNINIDNPANSEAA